MQTALHITVNGQPREIPAGATVKQLLIDLGLTGRAVAVEINRELVPRKAHETTPLRAGDVVEVVSLVGGG